MKADRDITKVGFSDLLQKKKGFPNLWKELTEKLNKLKIEYFTIKGTKDIWARDYMPIVLEDNQLVSFTYEPSYLKCKKYQGSITTRKDIVLPKFLKKQWGNRTDSDIRVDGGNIQKIGDKIFMTDAVFKENCCEENIEKQKEIKSKIEELLHQEVVIVPKTPGDRYGHIDSVVRHIRGNQVFVNDFKSMPKDGWENLRKVTVEQNQILKENGFNFIKTDLPYNEIKKGEHPNFKNNERIERLYINYLRVGEKIIFPQFAGGDAMDKNALSIIEEHFGENNVETVDCSELTQKGGALNCISWGLV